MRLGLKRNEVKLVPYTDQWHNEFLKVKKDIQSYTDINKERIEHIGSTSIKNMDAKPIIDIVVGVNDITKIDSSLISALNEIGFLRLRVEKPNDIVFARFTDKTYEEKTHYIHLVNYREALWNDLIFFRDYLNDNESERRKYIELKKNFIENEKGGIKEYTDYKEAFVRGIYNKRFEK
ncbi:GrpB family protein [Virgibacillus sp. MSJ-26]|uniref:GrpB family protein n=1 Tax=Virgibacillus sp. MSJ-26 TaxID=2841522 RepID=UPI001C10D5ED|nr:GrpB family protein [Virgibacillus sp. MSJ-26]MBU5466165.1 GrpB family protein [Virgibacillus sp. MSJ-26]